MPELDSPYGYPAVMTLIIGLCGLLFYRFRRAGWL
jgi:magnesium transporter